jgi:hypothetical protein
MSTQFRLILKKVETTLRENGECQFAVWLAGRGTIYTGEAVSNDNEESQLKAVAQATIQAINKALSRPIDIKLVYTRQIFITEIAKVIFMVIIQVEINAHIRLLPGICLFTMPTPEIAAQAVLNSLNRTIARYA